MAVPPPSTRWALAFSSLISQLGKLAPDTNMSSGESLIRQLIHGKRFYREEFGVDSKMLWLPDTFGYTAALPQILKNCGVEYMTTQKIFWTYNDSDRFPYHYFTWQGMDGTQITAFLHMDYTSRLDPGIWSCACTKASTRQPMAF